MSCFARRALSHRLANFLLGIPILAVIALVAVPQLEALVGKLFSDILLGIVLPSFVGVVFPSLTSRLFIGRG